MSSADPEPQQALQQGGQEDAWFEGRSSFDKMMAHLKQQAAKVRLCVCACMCVCVFARARVCACVLWAVEVGV